MSYGVVHQFKGGTKDQYEASIAAEHPADGSLLAGQSSASRPVGGRLDRRRRARTKESWETFRDSILMPRMQQGIPGGFTEPPQETVFEVVNEVRARVPMIISGVRTRPFNFLLPYINQSHDPLSNLRRSVS